tara:strand:- start:570 stop:968 length:399 start_codon:yes stop_codon:yes gene_type:complete
MGNYWNKETKDSRGDVIQSLVINAGDESFPGGPSGDFYVIAKHNQLKGINCETMSRVNVSNPFLMTEDELAKGCKVRVSTELELSDYHRTEVEVEVVIGWERMMEIAQILNEYPGKVQAIKEANEIVASWEN